MRRFMAQPPLERRVIHLEMIMATESREAYADMMRYFWEEKGDIERYSSFSRERTAAEFPEVLKAWDDYNTSRKVLSAVLRGLDV